MSRDVNSRLAVLGIDLPKPSEPGGNYEPYIFTGNLIFLTGQLCHWNCKRLYTGKLGAEYGIEEGREAARICALNLVSQLSVALEGDLNRVRQTIRLAGYFNSTPDFHDQSQVMNGASDLFLDLFGAVGRHTRMAVGVSALPYNVAAEVEAILEVDPV